MEDQKKLAEDLVNLTEEWQIKGNKINEINKNLYTLHIAQRETTKKIWELEDELEKVKESLTFKTVQECAQSNRNLLLSSIQPQENLTLKQEEL